MPEKKLALQHLNKRGVRASFAPAWLICFRSNAAGMVRRHRKCSFVRVVPRLVHIVFGIITAFCPSIQAEGQEARYIVRFREHGSRSLSGTTAHLSASAKMLRDVGLQAIDQIPHDNSVVVRLRFQDAVALASQRDVLDVELDERVWALGATNDTLLGEQTSLQVEGGSGAISAWDITSGSSAAMVAVIDSGADLRHPDLRENIWRNRREIAGNNRDDDRNGWVDDTYGYDFVNKDGSPQDDNGHGTHVAGIVAAVGNNSTGVAGVAWGSKIVVIKALDQAGSGYVSTIAKAIDYAVALKQSGVPIMILNLSLGGTSDSRALYRAVERARNHDLLLVAAAGNEGSNNDVTPLYPANFQLDSVISVAAVDGNGALANFSNYGASTVHLSAPGSSILSTALRRTGVEYRRLSGTSMASPHVAGVLALAASANPGLTALQVKAVVLGSTRQVPGLSGVSITGGIVDAFAATQQAQSVPALPRIFGYVKNAGTGVSGAQVTLISRVDNSQVGSVTTGRDGSYSISEVAAGQYILTTRRRGMRFKPMRISVSTARVLRKNFSSQR